MFCLRCLFSLDRSECSKLVQRASYSLDVVEIQSESDILFRRRCFPSSNQMNNYHDQSTHQPCFCFRGLCYVIPLSFLTLCILQNSTIGFYINSTKMDFSHELQRNAVLSRITPRFDVLFVVIQVLKGAMTSYTLFSYLSTLGPCCRGKNRPMLLLKTSCSLSKQNYSPLLFPTAM